MKWLKSRLNQGNSIDAMICLAAILGIVCLVFMLFKFSVNELSGYGSILSGFGTLFLFVGLLSQAKQIREQREQFSNTTRREALLMAKRILDHAEERAVQQSDGLLISGGDIFQNCLKMEDIKLIMESMEPKQVLASIKSWNKKMNPAFVLTQGVKSAATVYLQDVGASDIDYSKDSEDFISSYGHHLWNQPFFADYKIQMVSLCSLLKFLKQHGYVSVIPIAFYIATIKSGVSSEMFKLDKVYEDIKKHQEKGYCLPKIAENFMFEVP